MNWNDLENTAQEYRLQWMDQWMLRSTLRSCPIWWELDKIWLSHSSEVRRYMNEAVASIYKKSNDLWKPDALFAIIAVFLESRLSNDVFADNIIDVLLRLPSDRAPVCTTVAPLIKKMRSHCDGVVHKEGFTFFWGGYLSNWYPSQFVVDGVSYTCGEQWMMACKARLFNDQDALQAIMESSHPKDMKESGKRVRSFVKSTWDIECIALVHRGLLKKFYQNKELQTLLLETGNRTLVEASPYDRIWGIGLYAHDPRAMKPDEWPGENRLGKILERVRNDLS